MNGESQSVLFEAGFLSRQKKKKSLIKKQKKKHVQKMPKKKKIKKNLPGSYYNRKREKKAQTKVKTKLILIKCNGKCSFF